MDSENKKNSAKSGIIKILILVLIFAAITGIIIFELFYFGVLGYEPHYLDLTSDQLGSAKKLEGRTAMVTIFASDKKSKWDFTQEECIAKRRRFLDSTKVAADWLIEQGKNYDKTLEFCYAADENDELLYYEHDFGGICLFDTFTQKLRSYKAPDEWDFIENNIDSELIKEKLGCDNVAYYFYLNYGENNKYGCAMLMVKTIPNQKPYEIVWAPYQQKERIKDPLSIAHETLHLFGAIDLYIGEKGYNTFNVPEEMPDYARTHCPTDIMYISGGILDRTISFDKIDAEITDITAYYLGWTEKAPSVVDWYRMYRSQFDRKK